MKCKRRDCKGEVERGKGEFGKCSKCGTVYRFDESGYYYAKNESNLFWTEDEIILYKMEVRNEVIDFSLDIGKKIYWHSASHIMAMAVKSLFPKAKYAIGPAIDQGFYYDFDTEKPFSPENLGKIEKKMAEIVTQDIPFERITMKKEAVIEFFNRREEPYKVELVKDIPDPEVSLYRNNDFIVSNGKYQLFEIVNV